MISREPLPRIWLMTDERINNLDAAITRLPRRSGIIFRHYSLDPKARRALFDRVKRLTARRRHVLLLADTPKLARAWGADGAHSQSRHLGSGLRTMAVHSISERIRAERMRVDLMVVSPVFATRSHPTARGLGVARFGLLIGTQRSRVIALGGMNEERFIHLRPLAINGWAAIDGLSESGVTPRR